jgi:4-diphosphocytidyl-2-C-methyl-D-erythritol kinase
LVIRNQLGRVLRVPLEKQSPCKVNLLLNILGKRPDGFHELETVMHPVPVFDRLTFQRAGSGIQLTCTEPGLPTDSRNLVYRAAEAFLKTANINDGVTMHLEKCIPLAAGLGGGSGNAATTIVGLNEIFGHPLSPSQLEKIAASLGSDIPFFLQDKPALATGRGEKIQSLDLFPALRGTALLLIHPGFGIATVWAYQQLAKFPGGLNGRQGRAQKLISLLQTADLKSAAAEFYNSLEAPALEKYPLLALFQEFLRENGAAGTLMSGSGSSTFAFVESKTAAETLADKLKQKFGFTNWTSVVTLP